MLVIANIIKITLVYSLQSTMNKHDREMLRQIDIELQQGQNSIEYIEILLKRKENIISFYTKNDRKKRARKVVDDERS